jgi:3-dehydroquinate dehydratase-2
MQTVYVLNGPNLNLLGVREPEIYGRDTLADIEAMCQQTAKQFGWQLRFLQSNYEGALVEWVHEARAAGAAVVMNPAGCSFYSIPLLDALSTLETPYIEVHLSNIHARDADHQHSILSKKARGVICGFGAHGYELALQALKRLL